MTTKDITLWFTWMLLQPVKNNNLFNEWATKRRYYLRNIGKCKARAKAHRNSEAGRAYMRDWQAEQHRTNLQYKLAKNLRTRMWYAMQSQECSSKNVIERLGCTLSEFKMHIENQFKPGWTWDNWGTLWEIDHIKPCAKFDLENPEQVKECFHFSNQRPLGKFENRSKGSK